IWVAANGPMALRATGALGDGRISAGDEPPEVLEQSMKLMEEGAAKVGRPWPDDFHTACVNYSCVLEPGEKVDSERVIDEVGSMVTCLLHFWYENYRRFGDDSFVPEGCQEEWQRYQHHVMEMETPEERRYQQIHEGHCTFIVPEERVFVTENLIRASGGLVGTPDEIIETIRERERRGLKEITLLPPRAAARKVFRDFSEHVMARY
ncbi:MAG: LLM class flavin-dependent oxidoreductase, partial [Myxococcales bacterium]|nr:LLM class flavin-dependent oxidoreductase [Myxococcales bacterium]